MVSQHWVYQLVLCALLGLYVSVHLPRPTPAVVASAAPGLPEPRKPKGHCSHAPKPFAGLPHKPYGALCEQANALRAD